MRFGTSEVVRPLSLTKIIAIKETFFGAPGAVIEKVADTYKPTNEQEALAQIIQAIKHVYAGNSDYSCIEFYTEPKTKGVSTINICHMKRTK